MAKRVRLINSFDEDEDEDSTNNNNNSSSNKGLTNEDFKNLYNTKTTQESNNNDNENNSNNNNNDEEIDFGVLIVEFSQLTGEEDHSKILAILEKHNWKLETAVSSFLDDQDSSYYYQSTPSNYNTTNQDSNYNTSTTNQYTTPPQSSYESSYDAVAYHNYQKFYNSNSGRDDESDGEDDRNRFTNVTFADPTVMPKIIVDDQDDTSSMFVNPDTSRHDVSSDDEDDRDEAYYKSRSKYRDSLQMSDFGNTSTSDSKYIQQDDFSAFSTIEDHVSNSRQNEENEYYEDDNNNNNNNNNNDNDNSTSTTTTTTTTNNDWDNLSFNSFQNRCTVSDTNNNEENIGYLDYNTRYFCKLATQGSGWEPKPPLQRGRVSLKLLCVERLTGLVITHEKLIELLKLSEYVDVYAYHELVFGTAAQCYFTLRSLPSFKTLSDTTVTRIQDFM